MASYLFHLYTLVLRLICQNGNELQCFRMEAWWLKRSGPALLPIVIVRFYITTELPKRTFSILRFKYCHEEEIAWYCVLYDV